MNDLKIPVGISDFTKIRENGYYYIDKTELICSLLEPEPAEVTLITRPRRFRKDVRDEYACQLSGYSERQRKSV
ncbi:MAG: AAA family ATPase [Lachnospiraceae bacterium]